MKLFFSPAKVITAATVCFLIFSVVMPVGVKADLYSDLGNVQKKLAEINKRKQDLQGQINKYKQQASSYSGQINSLSAEISLLDAEISEKQLQIDELNLSISILKEEIETSLSVISQTEYDVEQMQFHVDSKVKGMYLDYKTGIGVTEIDASLDGDDVFKKLQYKSVLIEQTKQLVESLEMKVAELQIEKKGLEEKNVQLTRDKGAIDETKAALDSKKAELVVQRQSFYALQEDARRAGQSKQGEFHVLGDEEAKVRAQAEYIQQQIFANTGSVPNGSYVVAGTRVGYQGSTGISTGPHLHLMVRVNGQSVNPCSKLGQGPFGNCVGDGTLKFWPQQGTHYYTSGYGNRCYNHNGFQRCTFHDGIDLAHPNRTAPLFAPIDGWMFRGFDKCSGSLCNGGGANYVIICQNRDNCNSGVKVGMWHLSAF
jgi:peptidoglycan hydrolase CwlO-like protein